MQHPVHDARAMIAAMKPVLDQGDYVFCTIADRAVAQTVLSQALGSLREGEGMSLILPVTAARELGLDISMPMRRIVLEVYSALDGVGLTAAVANALAAAGIPCNMVAAYHHDHVFVPAPMAGHALTLLERLSAGSIPAEGMSRSEEIP